MNFVSAMEGLDNLNHDAEATRETVFENLAQKIEISGNIAVDLPEGAMLLPSAVQNFSNACDDLLGMSAKTAHKVIKGARKKIRNRETDPNPIYVEMVCKKSAILGMNVTKLAKHMLPHRTACYDAAVMRGKLIREGMLQLAPVPGSIALLH